MLKLVEKGFDKFDEWTENRKYWWDTAYVTGVSLFSTCFVSIILLLIKSNSYNPICHCQNSTTPYSNITEDGGNFTILDNNLTMYENVTLIGGCESQLWMAAHVPIIVLSIEAVGLFGEGIPGYSGILINKILVAYGRKPSQFARFVLICTLLYHYGHLIYSGFRYHDGYISSFDFAYLLFVNTFSMCCHLLIRYACSRVYDLSPEDEVKGERERLEGVRRARGNTRVTMRWNWFNKGFVFLTLYFLLTLCVVAGIVYVFIFYKEEWGVLYVPMNLWFLIALYPVFLVLELSPGCTDGMYVFEGIIYRKRFVAFGKHPSKFARNFLITNVLYFLLHSAIVIWCYYNEMLSSKHSQSLLIANVCYVIFIVTIRHSWSKFYYLTSQKQRVRIIKNVRNRKIRKVELEAAMFLKKATIV